MPKYAVEIGKVVLKSDKPITEDERQRVIREICVVYGLAALMRTDGGEVVLTVNGH